MPSDNLQTQAVVSSVSSSLSVGRLSLGDTLTAVTQLAANQLGVLHRAVQSEAAYDSNAERVSALASEIGLTEQVVASILSTLDNLYGMSLEDASDLPPPTEAAIKIHLREILSFWDNPAQQLVIDRLAPLLCSPAADAKHKSDRLQKGFLPNAIAFQSFVDLRPVFSSERDAITKFIVTSQFRIITDDDKPVIFQLSEESLQDFRAAVDLLEKKFAVLRARKNGIMGPPKEKS